MIEITQEGEEERNVTQDESENYVSVEVVMEAIKKLKTENSLNI